MDFYLIRHGKTDFNEMGFYQGCLLNPSLNDVGKAQLKEAEYSKQVMIETAKANLDKEKDAKKRASLENKYNKEFQDKRKAIAKNYETKLLEIDKNITASPKTDSD
mgnify:CR=1 FL=1